MTSIQLNPLVIKASEILKVNPLSLSLKDSRGSLVLVSSEADNVRGTVVDLSNNSVVCNGNGFIKTRIVNSFDEALVPEGTFIRKGGMGAMFRVFKNNGTIYLSTNSKLDGTTCSYVGKDTFGELYTKYGGVDPQTLFGTESSSPYVYLMYIVFPSDSNSSCLEQQEGEVQYLGYKKMYESDLAPADIPLAKSLTYAESQQVLSDGGYIVINNDKHVFEIQSSKYSLWKEVFASPIIEKNFATYFDKHIKHQSAQQILEDFIECAPQIKKEAASKALKSFIDQKQEINKYVSLMTKVDVEDKVKCFSITKAKANKHNSMERFKNDLIKQVGTKNFKSYAHARISELTATEIYHIYTQITKKA